jgi:hypothetical protein
MAMQNTSSQTAKDAKNVTWAGLEAALGVLEKTLVVCPPLKSAVAGLLECFDVLQVSCLAP